MFVVVLTFYVGLFGLGFFSTPFPLFKCTFRLFFIALTYTVVGMNSLQRSA